MGVNFLREVISFVTLASVVQDEKPAVMGD